LGIDVYGTWEVIFKCSGGIITTQSFKETIQMSPESRKVAGAILVILPTVMIGGVSILTLLIGTPEYMRNELRQNLWRAGHAHAGVFLILTLVALRYVDEAALSATLKWFVRLSIPAAAILLPVAFFLSILGPAAREPNAMIYLAYVGAVVLAAGVVVLGVGLLRGRAK
jgi:CDP-diglyceride synthetase